MPLNNRWTYDRAVRCLESFIHYEKTPPAQKNSKSFDLESFRRLLGRLDDPQAAQPVIHVAGTKGKGSVCAMIASMLTAAGYRVGMYTSPHLISYRERIRINGRWITPTTFSRHVATVKKAIEAFPQERPREFRTTFEILTAAAFLEFREKKVDVAVVETGLGGSLDATNVVTPVVAVLTPISLDHTELLGDTVARIARDKAGIIKAHCVPVIGLQQSSALAVIRKRCSVMHVRPVVVGKDAKIENIRTALDGTRWDFFSSRRHYKNLFCPLAGKYQAENGSLAVLAVETFAKGARSASVTKAAMRKGLAKVRWAGRFQEWRPGVILDGAHNPQSAKRLAESFRAIFPGKKAVLVVGISREKDVQGILRHLIPLVGKVIATQSDSPRALPAEDLAQAITKITKNGARCETDPMCALRRGRSVTLPGQLVLVTGSLFLIGNILRETARSRTV